MSVTKYLTLNGLTYFLNKIKTYLTSSTYLDSIGISNSDIDDIADDAGYSSGSLPQSDDIYITGDIIPNTDNSVDIGASSKNIKMVYTKGITINGTQFLPSNYSTLANTVKSLSISGKTITYTKGNDTTGTLTTQDTTYSAGTNLSLSGTTFNVSSTPSFTSITVGGYTITVD